MRVAVVQMSIDAQSRAHNQRRAYELIAQAADHDPAPEVICLPACCDGGMVEQPTASAALSEAFVEVLAAQAREMGVSLVIGFSEFDDTRLYHSAAWCDADGDVLAKRRRVTGSESESFRFDEGHAIATAHTLFGPIGVLAGEDACDASIIAAVAQTGASIIFAPASKTTARQAEQSCKLASQHHLWLTIVNSVGSGGGTGQSRIIDPDGQTVCMASRDREELLFHNIDLEQPTSCPTPP